MRKRFDYTKEGELTEQERRELTRIVYRYRIFQVSPSAFKVLCVMLARVNIYKTEWNTISVKSIVNGKLSSSKDIIIPPTLLGEKTVYRAIKELEDNEYIQVYRPKGRHKQPNVYRLTTNLGWVPDL